MINKERLQAIMEESRQMFIREQQQQTYKMMVNLMKYSLYKGNEEKEELYRFFHSIKGTSAMLEFENISAIGKEYEDYLEGIENKRESSENVSSTLLIGLARVYEEIEKLNKEYILQPMVEEEETDKNAFQLENEYTTMMNSGNILIVDDDIVVLNQLEKVFADEGYHVVITKKPQEVIQIVKENKIDVILLDIMMPQIDGFEVFSQLKEEKLEVPIIFLSAKTLTEDKVKALNEGADDYITKPFEAGEVVARVERAIKRVSDYKVDVMKDELTGAYTKKYFRQRVKEVKERLKRKGEVFTIAFLDFDSFKQINDTYGHMVGDFILEKFTRMVKENLRLTDQIFRFGGDEFLILFPDTKEDKAYISLERIRKYIKERPICYKEINELIPISFSAGLATMEDSNQTIDEILEKADQALYISKQAGKDQTTVADMEILMKDKKKSILIVDDANITIHMIKMRLAAMNYEVSYAMDGEDGIRKSRLIKPDLMIVDLMLPKLDGFEVCREVKNHSDTKNTKIIVLSGKNKKEDVLKCFEIGVDDYMIKPYSLDELEKRVKKLLNKLDEVI